MDALPPALVGSLLATAATALASARLLSRARRELRRAQALTSVAKELAGELDLTRVLDDIIERTRTLFGADRAGLWLFDGTPHPVMLASRGLSDRFLARSATLTHASETISMRAMAQGRPQWSGGAHDDPAIGEMRSAYAEEGIRTVCIVPLVSRGRGIGVIGLYHDADRTWPDEEIALVQAFADQAAVAMQNARLYQSVAESATRMRSIQDLSARLNRLTDVRAIGEAIVTEAKTLADYHDIRIYRVDRERGMCEPIAFTREMLEGTVEDAVALLRVRVGEGFTGWVAEHGEPLLINDALDDDRGKTIDGTEDVPESMLAGADAVRGRGAGRHRPLAARLQPIHRRRPPDDGDLRRLRGAGDGERDELRASGDAVERARRVAPTRSAGCSRSTSASSPRSTRRASSRRSPTASMTSCPTTTSRSTASTTRREAMVPVLARERHAEQVSQYVIPFGRGLMGWAVEHAEPILANDALADSRALQIPGTPNEPEAIIVVPLVAGGEVLGSMNVSRVGGEEVSFSTSEFELAQLFAGQASIALRNADAHHAVSRRADTDALTGLGNHGAFQHDLGAFVERAVVGTRAADRRAAMLMMDLDRFKAYNDRHGHPAGDALLHRVATAIAGAARTGDRVYRYGGDEFALILPGTTTADAVRLGERIRKAVNRITAGESAEVTITVGVASLPADATDRAGLIAAADMALYHGKGAGEDRVVRADRVPAAPTRPAAPARASAPRRSRGRHAEPATEEARGAA